MEERRITTTLRLPEQWHRLYKALCAEQGVTIQDDLEAYILRRLQQAGKLPANFNTSEDVGKPRTG